MASSKTCLFFENGTNAEFEYVLSKYDEAMLAKANAKSSKPETLLKLDKWYQNELPKKIKSRGKEPFLTHDEIVQCIKWKLARGQFRPRLKDLVQMNTPRVVMQETKKAFRQLFKKNDIESAVQALSNLKGVGPAMASAVLAAGAPDLAPFMADECLLALPEIEGIDYTLKEYLRLVEKTAECVARLNSQGGEWTPHKVELAIWTHYVVRDLKPEIFDDMPVGGVKANKSVTPKKDTEVSNGVTTNGVHSEPSNGSTASNGLESSTVSSNENSMDSVDSTVEPSAATDNEDSRLEASEEVASAPEKEKTVEEATSEPSVGTPEASVQTSEEKVQTLPEASVETSAPAVQTNGDSGVHKVNGVSEPAAPPANHSEESNSSTTKEESCNDESSIKRPLETSDEDISEAKRLKEDSNSTPSVPAPIQAN